MFLSLFPIRILPCFQALTSNKTNVGTSDTVFDSNLEQIDTNGQNTVGADMSESSGVFSFAATFDLIK